MIRTTRWMDFTLTLLGARLRVVERTLDPYLLACRASAGEDAAESIEPALVRRRNHLRDVHHQRTVDIARSNTLCTLIVMRALVQRTHAVLLSLHRGRQLRHEHPHQSVAGRNPRLHNLLQKLLANQVLVVTLELDTNTLEHLLNLVIFLGHDRLAEFADRVHDELAERTTQCLAIQNGRVRPNSLALGVLAEVVVTPETLHHLRNLDTELLRVNACESLDGERPLVQ